MARIELTCRNSATCISPWHMLWSSDRAVVPNQITLEGSRTIAFAIYLLRERGWTYKNIGDMTSMKAPTLRALEDLAGWLGSAEFVHGLAWDMLEWGRLVCSPHQLNGHHDNALLHLIRAGQELSCSNVDQLCVVGRELY
jgi:hypothetical protein